MLITHYVESKFKCLTTHNSFLTQKKYVLFTLREKIHNKKPNKLTEVDYL